MSRHPYADPAYGRALAAEGETLDVPAWYSFVLSRPIPGTGLRDAAGAYPRAALAPEADLAGGLEQLREAGLVSLVLAPDPVSGPSADAFAAVFERCRPFKTHYLVDRARGYSPTKHHRERIRRGLRRCRVEVARLADYLDGWRGLYAGLVASHDVTGTADFRDDYFSALATMPAITALAAFVADELAAMTLWFEHGGVAYSHLTASAPAGYANGAAFALNDAAIAHFGGCGLIDLGGAAGLADDAGDGLAAFKRGFANATATAHLCGAVLDPAAYARLGATGRTAFFPAYRG